MNARVKRTTLWGAFACLWAAGCMSFGPHVEPGAMALAPEERARLVVPDTSRHFLQISILTLNGRKIPGGARQLELSPGTHVVSLAYEGRTMRGDHLHGGERRGLLGGGKPMRLRFQASPGRHYHVYATRQGRLWAATIIDTETGKHVCTPAVE